MIIGGCSSAVLWTGGRIREEGRREGGRGGREGGGGEGRGGRVGGGGEGWRAGGGREGGERRGVIDGQGRRQWMWRRELEFLFCRDNRKVVAKRLDDFREKTQPQLAATLDP